MNKLIKFAIFSSCLLAITGISLAQSQQDICNQPWFPQGVSHNQCPQGLEYPTLNAYNDSEFLDANRTFEEKNFAWVREYGNTSGPYAGLKDSISFTDEDKVLEGYFYIHNSGRPDCNYPAGSPELRENNCKQSTILENVRLKLDDNFRRSQTANGETLLISDGIVSNGQRIHTFTGILSSNNGDPNVLEDSFTVTTPVDKSIYLNVVSQNRICTRFNKVTRNGVVKDDCIKSSQKSHTERTIDLVGSGVNLTSFYEGSNFKGNRFFASERYIREYIIFMKLTDAPDEELVCEDITATRVQGSASSTTQTYRIQFTPNEREFHQAIRVTGAESTQNFVDRTLLSDYTDITFTNLTPNTTATITSVGNGSDCATRLTFPDTPPPGGVCEELNLLEVSKTEDSVTFDLETTPSRFASEARVNVQAGTLVELPNNRYRLENITEATTVSASVAGSAACKDQKSFTPEPPVELVCESITLNRETYNYQENSRPTFRVTQKTPAEFQADFRWQVLGENNQVIQTQTGQNLLNFRPNSPLTGNERITVNVVNSNDPDCRGEITSELPPKEEVCEDLDIIRILNPQLRRTIPNNGQPAIFQLDGGDYEGQITFQAEGQPDQTVFITNDERTRGSITVDIDETVIILNTGENNTVRVFAQEQNQFTVNCNLLLRADGDDEGDKLTELDKSVDKAFATDGDILTYTIRYTISPIFGNENFREALEGLDTAILKDNIRDIYGIQDKLNNPLESRDSGLEILDLSIDSRLRDSTGDLFGVDGLVIEDLTEKAGNTYTLRYTARLEADIIEECQIITDSCGFEFPNTASDNFGNSDTASVLATCPFVVSRSFGDVFLEEEFEGTIDIARCTNKRNTEGPVFTPKERTPQELISSGSGAFSAPNHRICRESISANPNLQGRELEGYNNPLRNFSSSVCEVSLFTSANWTSEDIERNLRSNASRFQNVTNLNGVNTLESLSASNLTTYDALNPNPNTKVYRKTNGDLRISADSDIVVNDGVAKTIIVEGHDLIIDQNLKYQTSNNPFPSQIAFIVIGGDVVVSPEVTSMVGAIAAVPDANGNGGFIRRSQDTNKLLTIRGSIFGDSGPLFAGTSNPGNLLADQGAVTVIYDSGIILNTPPGLQSIIQFNQYQTVR